MREIDETIHPCKACEDYIPPNFCKSNGGCCAVTWILCRDCAHSYESIDGRVCTYGVCVDCVVPDDFFCAFGERRL